MQLFNQTRLCGLVLFAAGGVLLSQTYGLEGAFFDDMHPFAYPRALVYVLLALSALLVVLGTPTERKSPFPIFNRRSVLMGVIVIAYAASFSLLGFALSSFGAAVASCVVMGYGGGPRRWALMLVMNSAIVGAIYLLFWRVLKIPLPVGTLL